jgi:hypothetical protein
MNTRDLAPHSKVVVHGEIEVCSTCVNGEGNPVAWELAHVTRTFRCEVCDLEEQLTDADAYEAGWDYPPFIGLYGVVGPRTCPNCTQDKTAWWALVNGASFDELTERQQETVGRILKEQAP